MAYDDEEDSPHRTPELQRSPDAYIRRSTLLQTVGAIVGILGAILGGYRFVDAIGESCRIQVQNERNERINKENRFDQQLLECCWRHR